MKVRYTAEPTPAKFHASKADVRGLMGPVGSGKSVACVMEIFKRAMQQASDASGVRWTRFAVVRNTYPELKTTTIKTWQDWIPARICSIVYSSPIRGHMRFPLPDGTIVDSEILFIALDKPKDAGKVRSLELTGAWFNEVREMSLGAVVAVRERIGRYPAKNVAPLTWSGAIMDTNPPDDMHWYYKFAELGEWRVKNMEEKDTGRWEFFRQPGALIRLANGKYIANPRAENVKNLSLGFTYYFGKLSGTTEEYRLAFLCGQYATVFSGKPVYPEFSKQIHVAKTPLEAYSGLPLRLGWDFGLTPACIVGQLSPVGQLRILREYICERGGIKQFWGDVVQPALANDFPHNPVSECISFADPAGDSPEQSDIEVTPINTLCGLGCHTEAACTNVFRDRRQAVINFLTRTVADGAPGMVVDPRCKMIIKGFLGGYQFALINVATDGGELKYREVADKNMYSHPHDGLQYMALHAQPGVVSKQKQESERDTTVYESEFAY
jgi:hypothetical protein